METQTLYLIAQNNLPIAIDNLKTLTNEPSKNQSLIGKTSKQTRKIARDDDSIYQIATQLSNYQNEKIKKSILKKTSGKSNKRVSFSEYNVSQQIKRVDPPKPNRSKQDPTPKETFPLPPSQFNIIPLSEIRFNLNNQLNDPKRRIPIVKKALKPIPESLGYPKCPFALIEPIDTSKSMITMIGNVPVPSYNPITGEMNYTRIAQNPVGRQSEKFHNSFPNLFQTRYKQITPVEKKTSSLDFDTKYGVVPFPEADKIKLY